jgi:hypothetical protein
MADPDRTSNSGPRGKKRLVELGWVLAGIVLGQAVLYGPSLCGRKILLPLELLALQDVYLPRTPEIARIANANIYLGDPVYLFEPMRRFAALEIRQGRFPAWIPYEFAGVPFIEPRFSPFAAIQFCSPLPMVLAWSQMAVAIVAGLGAYVFFRRALGTGFWPAAICAWCYPLTAFFVFWQGYTITTVVCWLPWSLLAVDETIRAASRWAPLGLAAVTCLVLISGHLDICGQVLLASGVYGLWRLGEAGASQGFNRRLGGLALKLAGGWMLGFLLASPQVLPVLEYAHTGSRMIRRSAGEEERPPVGLKALPQTVLPDMYGGYGNWSIGNFRFAPDNHLESSAAAYAGIVATLLVAPLAWCSRRHRRLNLFWVLISLAGLSWSLNLPGFVQVLRLPGLNMMSHNRLTFVVAFALVAMTCVGLEAMTQGPLQLRRWLLLAPAALAGLGIWCAWRAMFLPEPLANQIADSLHHGTPVLWIRDLEGLHRVQSWFGRYYWQGFEWCAVGLFGWLVIWLRPAWHKKLLPALAVVLVGDLLLFAHGRALQCSPTLYFPRVAALEQAAQTPGRAIGWQCLPAPLSSICGLPDIRGYDSVDPNRMVDLLQSAGEPALSVNQKYAVTQFLVPRISPQPDGTVRLSPIMDLLGVRHVVFREPPFAGARIAFQGSDYWVMENPLALPRVFVPKRVELAADQSARLAKMADPQFDPREVAYVESAVSLPDSCRGTAEIVQETPTRITVSADMKTPGLAVLADRWDKGWVAEYNGRRAPILVADHAVRGVVVPAGQGTLEFRYAPASFTWGLRLCGVAMGVIVCWLGLLVLGNRMLAKAAPANLTPQSQK